MLALACLFLVTFASAIQAVHTHGQWLPHANTQLVAPQSASQLPGDEDHCPLCMAMHGVLPTIGGVAVVRLIVVSCDPLAVAGRVPEPHQHFARFSRPPPRLLS